MKNQIKNLVLSALFLAIAVVFPMVFHPAPDFGKVFLPMHIPVLLCGFICGWKYGGACGLLAPILSWYFSGGVMPPLYPVAIAMMLELCVYGILSGLFYNKIKLIKNDLNIILSLIIAMLGGRIVMGIAYAILLGFKGMPYSFEGFLSGAFITALPGIVIQLVLIPVIVLILKQAKLIHQS